jgi:UDP-N-acetylglucosamine--N-acetylmuramyl-(pentapeptide) pyrophosphoryl-undecaprenol N-acetylglucosamine transferase
VRKICVNFPQTANLLPAGKVVVTGTPIRKSLRNGDAQRGRDALGLSGDKPVLLIFGGSLGAATINRCVRQILLPLTRRFDVVHVAGPGNIDSSLADMPGYIQREYLSRDFGDLLAAADVVISRAGANSVYELLASRKPHILIPLPRAASRGDQIENAEVFDQAGMSRVILQENLTSDKLLALVESTWDERSTLRARIAGFEVLDSVAIITGLIRQTAR